MNRPNHSDQTEPKLRTRSLLPLVITVVTVVIVAALLVLNTCHRPASEPLPSTPAEEASAVDDQGEAEVSPSGTRANGEEEADARDEQGEAEVSPSGTRANGEEEQYDTSVG